MSQRPIRVRFAPSPTGPLHIGGVRTALYNFLFARQQKGTFILRIEDTDQNRFVPGAERYIEEALAWLGISPDEGPTQGGPHAPYRQSERKDLYRQYADYLLENGRAYYAFDTPEELEAMRKRLEAANVPAAQYNAITRLQMQNSLTLSPQEVQERIQSGEPYVIRIKIDPKEEVRFQDMIRGWVVVHSSQLDDKVLLKSDGMPTYHLANIVDDHLMEITHVIRGEEWLPSAPLHILLYRYLGWEDTRPQFVHLPLLLKPDGNGKLSKRDADRGGFPIFPLEWTDPATGEKAMGFKEEGYLPDATANFLALLGWNPGTEQELFSLSELTEAFSFERVQKAGARFDIQKARWYNQQYIKALPEEALIEAIGASFRTEGRTISDSQLRLVATLFRDRVYFLHEIMEASAFLFTRPTTFDEELLAKKWNDEAQRAVAAFRQALLESTDDLFEAEAVKSLLTSTLESQGIKPGKVMQALRLVLTGVGAGPDLMLSMELMGKAEVLGRLQDALDRQLA
jgi:glutamyl-tRNA synthetase